MIADPNSRDFPINTKPKPKVKVRPTVYGWFFVFLIFWIPFTAIGTANNFLLLIFFMLIGLVLVSHKLGKQNISTVTISRSFPDEVYANTPFRMVYEANTSNKVIGSWTLWFHDNDDSEISASPVLFEKTTNSEPQTKHVSAHSESRGRKVLPAGRLESQFPFGLAHYTMISGEETEGIVFPEIHEITEEIPYEMRILGTGSEKAGPSGTVPYHFRDYSPGDPYKHIDWKKTAASGKLTSKVLAEEHAREIVIRLERNPSEYAISRAASLIAYFTRTGTPITLAAPGFRMGPGKGRQFELELMTALALWEETIQHASEYIEDSADVVIDATGGFHWMK